MTRLTSLSAFRNPEIRVWTHYGKDVMDRHSCEPMENGAILEEIPSSNISLMVKIRGDFGSPPFLASYAAVNGGLQAGKSCHSKYVTYSGKQASGRKLTGMILFSLMGVKLDLSDEKRQKQFVFVSLFFTPQLILTLKIQDL